MESCRAAEHALIAALVLGAADPAEFSGRVRGGDFTDPAAGLLFEVVMDAPSRQLAGLGEGLPRLLRAREQLRGDGYPLRQMLEWLPRLPVPARPGPWAGLVVAASVSRVVGQCGVRLMQASETSLTSQAYGAGRVLAVAAAQRAAVHAAGRRWQGLPTSWRDAVPEPGAAPLVDSGPGAGGRQWAAARAWSAASGVDCELLSAVVAAPVLVERLGWLRPEDFTDPGCGELYATVRTLHGSGRPVDVITLAAALEAAPGGATGPRGAAAAAGEQGWLGVDPLLGQPAMAELLARQLMTVAVLSDAHAAGAQLRDAAGAPATAAGADLEVVGQALRRLDQLAERGRRWQQAHVHPGRGNARPHLQADRSLALVRPATALATPGPGTRADRAAGSSGRTAG